MTKVCSKCEIEKDISSFFKDKRYNLGVSCWCKSCKNKYRKKYSTNAQKRLHQKCSICKVKKLATSFPKTPYRKAGIESTCKDCNNKRARKNREIHSKKEKKRYSSDINFKLTKRLRNRMRDAIRNNQKTGSGVGDLGCSIPELKIHLESKFYTNKKTKKAMSWKNYSYYGWHIDHIKPLALFDLSDRSQFLKACHYTNLQPLWAHENMSKGKKYNEKN